MEEDGGVKAPVTRLRRRLSVETDDTKSPSAPSTPSKKRGGRLAAKPQLELIDEDTITNSPKRTTRKSIARDITEPEEKTVTPARRSTRAKSNTSLVSEAEEKVLTPARRSTRIKSNTSIVSEAAQSFDSPRAKRAVARRNSQIGSDTEASVTPARTRRTRKGSTSSIDKEGTPSVTETAVTPGRTRRTRKGSISNENPAEAPQEEKPSSLITEVISEEPESKLRKSTSETDNVENRDDSPSTRRSPRLMAKKGSRSKSEDSNEIESQNVNEQNENTPATKEVSNQDTNANEPDSQNDMLSISSANLIKELDTKPKKKTSDKNKSASDIEVDSKSKRHRTKSWASLSATPPNEGNFFSDNESTKKKLKKHGKIFNDKRLSNTGSGDGIKKSDTGDKSFVDEEDTEIIFNTSKKNRKSKDKSFNTNKSVTLNESMDEIPKAADTSNESNKENLLGVAPVIKDSTTELFEKPPSAELKSMVYIEDTDSNTGSLGKQDDDKQFEDDQCVPVVLHPSENQITSTKTSDDIPPDSIFTSNTGDEKISVNQSCEPMDIDETIPDNVSMSAFTNEDKLEKSRRKSSMCVASEADSSTKESKNKSKRKSLLSHSLIQDRESTNKSNVDSEVKNSSEDEVKQAVHSRKSSLSTQDEVDSSFKESAMKSKRKSSKSNFEEIENLNKSTLSQSQVKDSFEEIVQNKKTRKSSLNITSDNESITKKGSKRKSSLSHSTSEDLEKTENKTTLVLSQIKDISATDNNVSKSPQVDINELSRTKDGLVNKNLSINYMTSTPVQKKNMEKLGMQMNTSVITPNNDSKTKIKSKVTPKKDVSTKSKSSADSSSEEDSEVSDEESEKKNSLLDDEAEEASEDYESGDSQDEEERQYERENEILERGETLTTEDEISNDSDYEKDSFIVSSDPEDDELLCGSGDDLNMSDNELSMTAKSKNKYNERKMKEQKKASREMYEARHKLNESDKNSKVTKSKKNNRNRLDSSLLESGDENEISMPPKKNKRMRLESTLETSQAKSDTEAKETQIKDTTMSDTEEIGRKKKKSKRLSESACNESGINEKEITIINEENIEKDDPLSIKVKTEPKTPQKDLEISTIQFTDREDIEQVQVGENMSMMRANETSDPLRETMAEDENDEDSDYSISENEEIANNYDSVLKELNKENKFKQIKSHDISLNLDKKNKQKPKEAIVEELNLTQTKKSKKKVQDTPEQSKEKTVKRVFKKLSDNDEASSDSIDLKLLFSDESNDSSEKKNESTKTADGTDSFIPLKRTPGKTNIFNPMDNSANGSVLNNSSKKKNKKSTKTDENEDSTKNDDGEEFKFFIDTKGELSDTESSTKELLNTSSKKNIGSDVKSADDDGADSDDAPVEISYLSKKSKKRNKKTSVSVDTSITEKALDSTLSKTPKSEKKKSSQSQETEMPEHETSAPKTPASHKKKKNLPMSYEDQTEIPQHPISVAKTLTSEKKKKTQSESLETGILETAVPKTPASEKKKNKLSESNENPTGISETIVTDPKTPLSAKKKKNKLSESHEEAVNIPEPVTSVVKTPSSNKKQKKDFESAEFEVEKTEVVEGAKKRKRKSSANQTSEEIMVEDATKVLNISGKLNESIGNKKKKQKMSETTEGIVPVQVTETKLSKKRKERDDDDGDKRSKVLKEHSLDKVHVPRLSPSLINRLDDKPKAEVLEMKKAKVVSTTDFVVEETRRKRNKPSNFLEESVYLNDDDDAPVAKKKAIVKKPKVLPFLPTVSTSDNGFTTNFQVNVISQTMEFVAKKNEMPHFKEEYLNNRKIKKLRTYDLYKKHRNVKLSKF